MGSGHTGAIAAVLFVMASAGHAGPMPVDKAAALFGARPAVEQISLSPDGTRVAYVTPTSGRGNAVMVASIAGEAKAVAVATGAPFRLRGCGWSAADRLVRTQYGIVNDIPFTRMTALDSDGRNGKPLAKPRGGGENLRISQYDGRVIDWMSGKDGIVLMTRDFVPQVTTGSRIRSDLGGLGVERVDTRTLQATRVEKPHKNASAFIADGRGDVRIMIVPDTNDSGLLGERIDYFYREAAVNGTWKPLTRDDANGNGWQPIAVDSTSNVAFALHKLNGRLALYRMSLDGKATTELVYAHPQVDVDDVIQVGRSARVIGASYVTDRRETKFFDPAYDKLMTSLGKAVPRLPLISFIDASADENVLLLRASSDVDPGRYYILDRARHDMKEILLERPALETETLSPVRAVTYRADDGTMVPAYLTLPVGVNNAPAIVMPHGGPASRDEWGFDWLAQFYAARGYAVLQPNFRGSSGYGDTWFADNGFRSWKIAIGDVAAARRWLVAEGIAAPDKLAIVGWSYGGYAALQAGVTEPALFKAIVAIAPVTDLAMLKRESETFTSARLVQAYIGSGLHIAEGSPLRHAAAIRSPVLMFHGDQDLNVAIAESRAMDQALRAAKATSELVTYKGLDHQLADDTARTDMLRRSDAFLRSALGL